MTDLVSEEEYSKLQSIQSLHLNFLSAPEQYKKRVSQTPHLVNSDPSLVDQDIALQHSSFKNVKRAYLAQETKYRFVEEVVKETFEGIDDADSKRLVVENDDSKAKLKEQKARVKALETEINGLTVDLLAEYDALDTSDLLTMLEEIESMKTEITELESKHAELRIPDDEDRDPDLLLPLRSIQEMISDYNSRITEADDHILSELQTQNSALNQELTGLQDKADELQRQAEKAEQSARSAVLQKEKTMTAARREEEAVARLYSNLLYVLETALGVKDFSMNQDLERELTRFKFKILDADVEILSDSRSGILVSAVVIDAQNRISNNEIEKLITITKESHNSDPSYFMCNLCYILSTS